MLTGVTHDEFGWWLEDAGVADAVRRPPLRGRVDAKVVVVGGGYTGMWTACRLAERIDPEHVVLLDRAMCGTGPSGRNGGFCQGLGESIVGLSAEWGPEVARECVELTEELAIGIGDWAESAGLDVHFRQGGELVVECGEGQDSGWSSLVDAAGASALGSVPVLLDRESVRRRCDSPAFGKGLFMSRTATVHPGFLALGLRDHLLRVGVRIHEDTRVGALSVADGRVRVDAAQGVVVADAGVIACGVESADWPGLRRELTLTSSHMVMTEPVPDVLDELGWRGGEAIVDGRTLVHYFRTTRDDRIAFGWGGGRVGFGVRPGRRESVDPRLAGRVAEDLLAFFPQLRGKRIDHAWGGPIDASPGHLPTVRPLQGGLWHAAFGYTGNGVGPSRSCGLLLAELALDRGHDPGPLRPLLVKDPRRVPPEPFRWIGGSAIMKGIDLVERAGVDGADPGRVARFAAGIPARLGYSIGR